MRNKFRSLSTFLSTLAVGALLLTGAQVQAMPTVVNAIVAAPQLDGKLNVNDASAAQWELLPGIGPATAKKLVTYRAKRKFGDLTHLMRIKGIGRKTYNQIKPFLMLNGESTLHVVKKRK